MRRPSDPEMGIPASAGSVNPFSDKYIRIGFIRKVYAILSVQLLITAAIIAAFIFVPELNKFAKTNGIAMTFAGFYKRDEVMMAVGITAIDFTTCTAVSFVLIILLLIFGIVVALFPSKYIVMDTQMIVGGSQRKNVLSPEDYIAGALTLYLDAINLFLFILQILNQLSDDK
ncbi:hypothetical protein HPB50_003943 [Hyalomma asiaticum]|uniref:Uncharacterized protein n=1 Tax=Hyalomma asiaticum TaxID=266040 RepID=A0ACB7RI21_HYAAI|nr:hypothetical protein HPB50_003943 [Hyalomma asiaticum]